MNQKQVKELEALKEELRLLKDEKNLLLLQKETLERYALEDSVPKEKLKQESFLTRVRWWVRDAGVTPKTIAAVVVALVSALTGMSLSEMATWLQDSLNESQEYIMIITMILQFFGITIVASKDPKKIKEKTLSNDISV